MSELEVWKWVVLIGWPAIGFFLSVSVMLDMAKMNPAELHEYSAIRLALMMLAITLLWPIYVVIILIRWDK